jgi:hypothetical protein
LSKGWPDLSLISFRQVARTRSFTWLESMRFCGAAMERLKAALVDGQVNILRWRATETDSLLGAPQILMLPRTVGNKPSLVGRTHRTRARSGVHYRRSCCSRR